ncbi:hypothetical protein [Mycobacterium sp. TY815]|uniref:hypothetical protein n=1 Tax=Mycobacterium sp. TY815 TaxID=3050581 RepID=UPI0027410638|nr:hypothetical protein [Mycobacterium sp. TY815]MDP7707406.1 hypothetical protein [Mycobacterium sp. TY815]
MEDEIAALRARVVNVSETNLLLLAAQDDLAAAFAAANSAAEKYRQALSLYMTPGHVGDLNGGY